MPDHVDVGNDDQGKPPWGGGVNPSSRSSVFPIYSILFSGFQISATAGRNLTDDDVGNDDDDHDNQVAVGDAEGNPVAAFR